MKAGPAFTKTIAREVARRHPSGHRRGGRFFASEEAGYITRQTLSVSGGLTMA